MRWLRFAPDVARILLGGMFFQTARVGGKSKRTKAGAVAKCVKPQDALNELKNTFQIGMVLKDSFQAVTDVVPWGWTKLLRIREAFLNVAG